MLFWRKIFDHNPLFVTFCDKLATKEFIKSRVPEAELPETLWVGTDVADIPDRLRNDGVVLKANHGSTFNYFGGYAEHERAALRKLGAKWMRTDYGRSKFEWGYFGVRKLLFLERKLSFPEGGALVDVSVRCTDGKAILASATTGNKTSAQRFSYFDVEGRRCPQCDAKIPDDERLSADFRLPPSFPLAVEYAERLSVGIDYARYDFLCLGEKLYPGEITVYPGAGLTAADDAGLDAVVVREWDLRKSWFLRTPQRGWKKPYALALREHLDDIRDRTAREDVR